jgi:hypothetical protein
MEGLPKLSPSQTKRRMRVLGWVALASMVALVALGPSAGGAGAIPAVTNLHQTPPIPSTAPEFQGDLAECAGLNLAAGQVLWHFVLVQTTAPLAGSQLHATFATAGDITVNANKKSGGVLHFDITTGADTLTGAHTNRAGRWLNLSHICQGPPVTTTTTTTTTTTETTTGPTPCNTETTAGGFGVTSTVHELGQTSGTFHISWDMLIQPDQLDVYYAGALVYTTGAPVSGVGSADVSFGPGASTQVTVVVTGPEQGTLWSYTVNCPNPAS